jgi:hypothetical protein
VLRHHQAATAAPMLSKWARRAASASQPPRIGLARLGAVCDRGGVIKHAAQARAANQEDRIPVGGRRGRRACHGRPRRQPGSRTPDSECQQR